MRRLCRIFVKLQLLTMETIVEKYFRGLYEKQLLMDKEYDFIDPID
jgi:hypothetical protein